MFAQNSFVNQRSIHSTNKTHPIDIKTILFVSLFTSNMGFIAVSLPKMTILSVEPTSARWTEVQFQIAAVDIDL